MSKAIIIADFLSSVLNKFLLGRNKINPRLVMTLLVRNEEDIVRQNIEYHLRHGVDFIIATDNASSDNTREILLEFKERGVLYLIDEPEMNMDQAVWNNRMARIAVEKFGADMIFHCDADEFWTPKGGNLKTELWHSFADIMTVNVVNVLLEDKNGVEKFPDDTKYAVIKPFKSKNLMEDSKNHNLYWYEYPPKVIFKLAKGILEVSPGNHSVVNNNNLKTRCSRKIRIFHFPLRGKERFVNKAINSGEAVERNISVGKGHSFHIRQWYDAYKNGAIDLEYKKLIISKEDASKFITAGRVRLFNFEKFWGSS